MSLFNGLKNLAIGVIATPIAAAIDTVTMGAEMFSRESEEPYIVSAVKKIGEGVDEILED